MSVHLVPNKELQFHGPFTRPVKSTLIITNDNATPVAFKMRTTAPKLFIVRPNQGRIEPRDSIVVIITFSPAIATEEQISLYERRSDRFLVQSTSINSENTEDPHSMWNVPHGAGDERKIHSQKITAMYLPLLEEDKSTNPDEINHPTAVSTQFTRLPSASLLVGRPPSPQSDSSESRNESRRPPGSGIVNADLERTLSSSPGLTVRSKQVLEQQLSDAQEEIRHLRTLLARSGDGTNSATDADVRTRSSGPKSLTSGVESMVAALSNFVHPLASPGLLEGAHS